MQFDIPDRIAKANPDAGHVAQIRRVMIDMATPVQALPSNGAMMLFVVGCFVILAALLAAPFGFYGFEKLSAGSAVTEYAVVLLLASVLAGGAVEQMIPGSRRVIQPVAGVLVAISLLSGSASLLFPDFSTHEFIRRGIPCLRLGMLCAMAAGVLVALAMRRGFVTDAVQAAITCGALSGLLGVGVLALHCPILNAAHIISWHVSVVAVTSVVGALVGGRLSRLR